MPPQVYVLLYLISDAFLDISSDHENTLLFAPDREFVTAGNQEYVYRGGSGWAHLCTGIHG